MKDKVLKILQDKLSGAEDNLYRANMQFGKMTDNELAKEFGQSGKTCLSILRGYQLDLEEKKLCVEWVKNVK